MNTTVASKVRKGQIIRFSFWAGGATRTSDPVRVTKRERWSETRTKAHFESALFPGTDVNFEHLPSTHEVEVLTEEQAMAELDKATAPTI